MGPIRCRIVCGNVNESENYISTDADPLPEPNKPRRGPKRKALMPAPFLSPTQQNPALFNATDLKNDRAADVEERLKLQVLVGKLSDDIKRKEQEVRYLQKKVQPIYLPLSKPSNLHLEFKKGIGKLHPILLAVNTTRLKLKS
jgi:hypothetical protein